MSNLRPESRIKSLENRATDIEARIEELSSDQAEELKAIRQEIKQGHLEIGQALDSHAEVLTQKLTAIEASMVTKNDLKQELEAMVTKNDLKQELEAMVTKNDLKQELEAMVTKNDLKQELEAFETRLLAKISQMLQQRPKE